MEHCADSLIAAKPILRTGAATKNVDSPLEHAPLTGDEDVSRLEFLRLLSFAEMDFREQTVHAAFNATHEWMLNSPEYSTWKRSLGQRLLIKGKAGCGKSTLMKHLFKHETLAAADSDTAPPVICGFFFNGRGSRMEKTIEGLLRTVLHQIVFQNPPSYRALSQFHADIKKVRASREHSVDWTGETLIQMFEIVMRSSTTPTLIFIDALDEGEGEGERFSTAAVFTLLEQYTGPQLDGRHAPASICLSSRPDNFVNCQKEWTPIDMTKFNSEDIKTYTTGRLSTMVGRCQGFGYEQLAAELERQILDKADGVFLWVRLVVDEITAAMKDGECVEHIRSQLSATPADLWKMFERMMLKVKDHRIPDMERLLKIVLAAERPLSVEELVHVLPLSSNDPPRALCDVWDENTARQTCEKMKKQILLHCGGLVEVVETERSFNINKWKGVEYKFTTQVQFIHQSIKDYLNSTQVPKQLAEKLDSPSLEQSGHKLLLTVCLRYLQLPETAAVADPQAPSPYMSKTELNAFWKKILAEYPFLFYSPLWVRHAEQSITTGHESVSRERLQTMEAIFRTWRSFPYPRRSQIYYCLYAHIYENMKMTLNEAHLSLLTFSAYQGFVRLFEKFFHAFRSDVPQQNLDQTLIAACDCGLEGSYRTAGVVGTRRNRRLESEKRGFGLPEAVWRAKETIVRILLEGGSNPKTKMRVGRFGSALTAACWGGRLSIVQMLLDFGAEVNAEIEEYINEDIDEDFYANALIASVWGSSTAVTELLIKHGADVNAQVKAGNVGSALAEAAIVGDSNMVKTLINSGAEINLLLNNGEFGSALAAAANEGIAATAKLLIERGAKVNLQIPGPYGSALVAAGMEKSGDGTEIMEILLGAGAEVDLLVESGAYGSALAAAAVSNHGYGKERVELLLRQGANPNLSLKSGYYGAALIAAAWSYDWRTAEAYAINVLLERGADTDPRPHIGLYGSPLVAAAAKHNLDFVKLLVARGADVNAVLDVGRYGSALAAAAACYHSEFDEAKPVVLFLLECGADINAILPVGTYGSALGAAAAMGVMGSQEMTRLLLEHGAELSGNERPLSRDNSDTETSDDADTETSDDEEQG
ncbi:ankyrin repeat-containing domain protein [Cladorrhinum sp. PSN259]|nr:ankyrin repeat-containing domain protein [Cladorrhinum sp. PSN259]